MNMHKISSPRLFLQNITLPLSVIFKVIHSYRITNRTEVQFQVSYNNKNTKLWSIYGLFPKGENYHEKVGRWIFLYIFHDFIGNPPFSCWHFFNYRICLNKSQILDHSWPSLHPLLGGWVTTFILCIWICFHSLYMETA